MTHLNSLEALEEYVAAFLATLAPASGGATVVTLSGDLGAGKTTFVKALARQLRVREEVTSPTFVIERLYDLPKNVGHPMSYTTLVHIDAYRLTSAQELEVLGWKEVIADKNNLILLEWPEMVEGAIPGGAIRVRLEWISETERDIAIS